MRRVWHRARSTPQALYGVAIRAFRLLAAPVTCRRLKISEILKTGPSFSFEFFPPRSEQMEETLARTLVELEPLGPSYVSVTYGAGGSTRERTHDLVVQILRDTSMVPMAHLTCACHTRA